jgi:PTS system ascorbate-specific IIA component
MSVGLLIITHDGIGAALFDSAVTALGLCPLPARILSATRDCDPEALQRRAQAYLDAIDDGNGVLVLTDLYGSTPSNVANRLLPNPRVRIVTGLNLPMLIRVLNYPELGLTELAAKAESGGLNGIFAVPENDS